MFQNFTSNASPEQGPPRLAKLRRKLDTNRISGFIIPRADRFQGEYVAPCDERLAWLTGFTGSAGYCVVLGEIAGIFVDGRYRLQVREQSDLGHFTPVDWPENSLQGWIAEHAGPGDVIGFDPWLHTPTQIRQMESKLKESGITLSPCENLIDQIWEDRPAPPAARFFVHSTEFAGETHHDKRNRIAQKVNSSGAKSAFIALADSVAWLFNIRGGDIEKNPVPHAMSLLHDDGRATLFAAPEKADDITGHLGDNVNVRAETELEAVLRESDGPILIDPDSTPYAILQLLEENGIQTIEKQDPCILPKACKNETEIKGMKEAHRIDGVAMAKFLAWTEMEMPTSGTTEIDLVSKLEEFRREAEELRDISFDSICGSGPHGAIMHYRVTHETNREVGNGDLIVVDSGGQYLCGTTDITRTLLIGSPSEDQKRCYTRVLQGLIAISRTRFPKGVAGCHLDSLARYPLWLDGLDFDHGTGHGVGAYLCVHEGPQRLSRISTTPLELGMILSNEPGYYRNGAFGIRLENLIVTVEAESIPAADGHRTMYAFENLTWTPFNRRLIDTNLLSEAERDWIDEYHAQTLAEIGPRLDAKTCEWLKDACKPL